MQTAPRQDGGSGQQLRKELVQLAEQAQPGNQDAERDDSPPGDEALREVRAALDRS